MSSSSAIMLHGYNRRDRWFFQFIHIGIKLVVFFYAVMPRSERCWKLRPKAEVFNNFRRTLQTFMEMENIVWSLLLYKFNEMFVKMQTMWHPLAVMPECTFLFFISTCLPVPRAERFIIKMAVIVQFNLHASKKHPFQDQIWWSLYKCTSANDMQAHQQKGGQVLSIPLPFYSS